jgi:hypothetical protein
MTLGSGYADIRTQKVRRNDLGSECRGREKLELEEARFDTVAREALLPYPAPGEPGDRKPEFD